MMYLSTECDVGVTEEVFVDESRRRAGNSCKSL